MSSPSSPGQTIGDALAQYIGDLGLDPTLVRPYGAAEAIVTALRAAGYLEPLSWLTRGHRLLETCPGCGQAGLSIIGIPKLAYTYETCECGTPSYPHLVEQLWHRQHIGRTAEPVAATARREAFAEAQRLLMKEAGRGEGAAPARQQVTYTGGLRRGARLLDALLGQAMDAEKRMDEIAGGAERE